jgi:predicted phosphoribosyltransferase
MFQTDFFRDKAWNIAIIVDDRKATDAPMKAALRGVK